MIILILLANNHFVTVCFRLPPSAGQVISLDENRQPSILDSRRNIFDNDEFDLLSRETISVNKSKIHMGPRE